MIAPAKAQLGQEQGNTETCCRADPGQLLPALPPRPRIIPCPGAVAPRAQRCPAQGTQQGFTSQKAPGALPQDPRDPRTMILPKKSNQIPGIWIQPNFLGSPRAEQDQLLLVEDVGQVWRRGHPGLVWGSAGHTARAPSSGSHPATLHSALELNSSFSFYLPKGRCTQRVQLSRKSKENLQVS